MRPKVICSVDDCQRPVICKSLCEAHYRRLLRSGKLGSEKPIAQTGITYSDPSVFWTHVQRSGSDNCWPWLNAKHCSGYGRANRRGALAHRIAWELTNGPIPAGLNVCHKCDNPPCCNPAHLFLGTQADNTADMRAKGRAVFPPRKQFEQNGRSKLTQDKAKQIRSLRQDGWTYPELAKRFSVSEALIWQVLRGAVWRTADYLEEKGC